MVIAEKQTKDYSAYFHHEEVLKTEVNKILGKNKE